MNTVRHRDRSTWAGAGLTAALLTLLGGCEDGSYRDVRSDIGVVTERDDALVPPAMNRLTRHGRAALPQIETALHTAKALGRRRLLEVLGRIGDPEGTFILRQVAVFDVDDTVRAEAERAINRCAEPARGNALAWIASKRAAGHIPIARGEP